VVKGHILIVDDEKSILQSLEGILKDEGYSVTTAENGARAMEIIRTESLDLVLLDIWMPDMDGIKALKAIKEYRSDLGVIIMSGHGTVETAVKAIKLGAMDYIEKPLSLDNVLKRVGQGIEQQKIVREDTAANKKILEKSEIIGKSGEIQEIKKGIEKASRVSDPILIIGEKGTGKELIARIIHNKSKRGKSPFVEMDCSSLQEDRILENLFGGRESKKKGGRAKGKIESTEGGTLFLNEVFKLSMEAQNRLLKYFNEKGIEKNKEFISLDTRIVGTTSFDIEQLLKKGEIQYDLLEHLSNLSICLPPLRSRKEDIPLLIDYFLSEFAEEHGKRKKEIDSHALESLTNYPWPGNIKELKNILERIIETASHKRIILKDIPENVRGGSPSIPIDYEGHPSMKEAKREWEKEFILYHLKKNDWDINKTSAVLKIEQKLLARKIASYGISIAHYQSKNNVFQRTLKRSMVLYGKGLHSGSKSGLILLPLPPNSGIHFGKVTSDESIPAHINYFESADYATSLKKGNLVARTIEHLLAVLHMYRINNLLIKINDEVPIMDGSAKDFCELIEDAGIEEQNELIEELVVEKKYSIGNVSDDSKYISIEPSDKLTIDYTIDYPPPVGKDRFVFTYEDEESFKENIAPARTFGFLKDIEKLEQMGLGSGGRLDNFILIDDEKIVNTKLRFPDEFVRHKILDILGDFYLLGKFVRGKITARMTGHKENLSLLKKIYNDKNHKDTTHLET
jgi:UDP-3-O-acyl N-acetylglucosamine deacetylase